MYLLLFIYIISGVLQCLCVEKSMENIYFPVNNAFGNTDPLTHVKCDTAYWDALTSKIDANAAVKKWFLVIP